MNHLELLAAHLAAETDGSRSPSSAAADVLVDERTNAFERLAAADLVLKMRNVDALAGEVDELERKRYAEIFERVGKQFEAAALRLRRHRSNRDTPEYLREGSEIPLRAAL